MASTPKETTQKVEPWDGAKPYLTSVYSQYDNLVRQGSPQTWSGPTVADQSAATQQAQQQQVNYATNPANSQLLTNAQNATSGIASGASTDQSGNNALRSLLGGVSYATDPSASGYGTFASGSMVGKNPWLDASVSNATAKIADQLGSTTLPTIQGQAAGVGRLGSNASASLVNGASRTAADAMSKVATDMYANQYNQDIANVFTGLQGQSNVFNQATANAFSNAAVKSDAANSLNTGQNQQQQTQLSAAGMAGDQYQNGLLPSQVLAGVGQQQDDRAQNVLNNQIALFDQEQQKGLTNLANFANVLNGGGYSNTTTPVYSNTGGQILGGLTSVLGLLLSDKRAKRIHRLVEFGVGGIPIYEWSYKHDNDNRIHVGPLAQDVEAVMRDAVVEIAGAKFIVTHRYSEAA